MSLLSKLMDTMRLGPEEDDEDYYLDDDFEEEAPRKPLFGKKNSAEYDEEEEPPEKPRFLGRSNPKVVPMRRGMEVTTIKPTSMEDSRDICDDDILIAFTKHSQYRNLRRERIASHL